MGSLDETARRVASGQARASADVLTRPASKAFLLPTAASILGPAEIAYHAESLALFPLFGIQAPVLVPRGSWPPMPIRFIVPWLAAGTLSGANWAQTLSTVSATFMELSDRKHLEELTRPREVRTHEPGQPLEMPA